MLHYQSQGGVPPQAQNSSAHRSMPGTMTMGDAAQVIQNHGEPAWQQYQVDPPHGPRPDDPAHALADISMSPQDAIGFGGASALAAQIGAATSQQVAGLHGLGIGQARGPVGLDNRASAPLQVISNTGGGQWPAGMALIGPNPGGASGALGMLAEREADRTAAQGPAPQQVYYRPPVILDAAPPEEGDKFPWAWLAVGGAVVAVGVVLACAASGSEKDEGDSP